MKVTSRALLKFKDQSQKTLALFRVEDKVFRWINEGNSTPYDGVDYLSQTDAIRGLRVLVDRDPGHVGVDMTILPVELPPVERAAKRILQEMSEDESQIDPCDIERVAAIIENETCLTELIESVNLLLAYEIPRCFSPKIPGLDMAWGGMTISILEALEKSQKIDLTSLKSRLTEGVKEVKVYSSIPGNKAVN